MNECQLISLNDAAKSVYCWQGCDASILLDSNSTNLAEKDGAGNVFSVRGYEVIDNIKEALEAVCPQTVSCADIIILASRDAIASVCLYM